MGVIAAIAKPRDIDDVALGEEDWHVVAVFREDVDESSIIKELCFQINVALKTEYTAADFNIDGRIVWQRELMDVIEE